MDESKFLEEALQQRQEALIIIEIARQQRWQAIIMAQQARDELQEALIKLEEAKLALKKLPITNIDPAIWITGYTFFPIPHAQCPMPNAHKKRDRKNS
ncbi:hypothetical protein NIES2107_60900 [Nostoc carneum NIES-2107]|nr:hypothetical protein NIES2107_60900 [Nostoc carneum NIES-2107]